MSETLYVINLNRLYWTGRRRRGVRALKFIREFIARHTKAKKVILDNLINEFIHSYRMDKPPRKIIVKVTKIDEHTVKASLAVPIE